MDNNTNCNTPSLSNEEGHSLELVAYHEAGHAYIAAALGCTIPCVRAIPAKEGYIGVTPTSGPPMRPQRYVMLALSGVLGQWLYDSQGRSDESFVAYAEALLCTSALRFDRSEAEEALGSKDPTTDDEKIWQEIRNTLASFRDDILAFEESRSAIKRIAEAIIAHPDHCLSHNDIITLSRL